MKLLTILALADFETLFRPPVSVMVDFKTQNRKWKHHVNKYATWIRIRARPPSFQDQNKKIRKRIRTIIYKTKLQVTCEQFIFKIQVSGGNLGSCIFGQRYLNAKTVRLEIWAWQFWEAKQCIQINLKHQTEASHFQAGGSVRTLIY